MGISIPQSTMSRSPNALEVYRGQSLDVELIASQPTVDVDNNPTTKPFDLTGCTIYFTVKLNGSNVRALITKTSADSTQIQIETPPTLGKAIIFLAPADTKNLEPDTYQFDVWVRIPNGEVFPIVEVSEFVVLQPITVI